MQVKTVSCILRFKHYEVAKYYSYTRHIVHPDVVVASTNFLDSMSAEDRAIFDELVMESTEYDLTHLRKLLKKVRKKQKHTEQYLYIQILTNSERNASHYLTVSLNQSDMTKDIYNKVEALRDEN